MIFSISDADRPLAYSPPTTAPMLVPAMASTGTRICSSTFNTPTWAAPRAPPPESTSPTRGRRAIGAAAVSAASEIGAAPIGCAAGGGAPGRGADALADGGGAAETVGAASHESVTRRTRTPGRGGARVELTGG